MIDTKKRHATASPGATAISIGAPAGHLSLRRRVGYVTQAPSVYGNLTVMENLRYFSRVVDAPGHRVDVQFMPAFLLWQIRRDPRTILLLVAVPSARDQMAPFSKWRRRRCP